MSEYTSIGVRIQNMLKAHGGLGFFKIQSYTLSETELVDVIRFVCEYPEITKDLIDNYEKEEEEASQ